MATHKGGSVVRLFSQALKPALDSPYARHVNPQWVRVLELMHMNVDYARCEGVELFTVDGRRILDFFSGYGVHNLGHKHPRVVAAVKSELERHGPAMLQSHAPRAAGDLAKRLCTKAGGRLTKAFFASSGSEGIETVIKFAQAHTGRQGLLHAEGGFHGLTCGALSLMSNPFWAEGFGPLLPHAVAVPFGDLDALAAELMTERFATFVVEPVQAENGIRVPDNRYLSGPTPSLWSDAWSGSEGAKVTEVAIRCADLQCSHGASPGRLSSAASQASLR
jgi:ornithine--oxo-acid transaminase